MMKRAVSCLLLAALLLGAVPDAVGEETGKITYTAVTQDTLNLRKTASPSGTAVDKVAKGKQVEVLSNDGMWCKVKAGKRTGYLMASHLTMKGSYGHMGWGRTENDGTVLNLRQQADAASPVVYKAASGGIFELVSRSGDWYYVKEGEAMGYVEAGAVTPVEGEFTLGYTYSGAGEITADTLRLAPREVGDAVTREGAEGGLSFHLTYPDLHLEEADARIVQWIGDVKQTCAADLAANHPDVLGSLTAEYRALQIGSRYQSVVLLADYRVGNWRVPFALILNIDGQEGKVIPPAQLISDQKERALFCLESAVSSYLMTPADGYTGKPGEDWFQYAALSRAGIEVFLPTGLFLPAAAGSRSVEIPYAQLEGCLGLDDAFMAPYKRTIDPTKPMIALTFDDGPSEQTDRILKVLAQYNARATFCVVGSRVEGYADVLKRTVAQGNEIASHTWDHKKLTTLSVKSIRSQLSRTSQAVKEIAGFEIRALRPPYGSTNKNVRSVCKDSGMYVITWNIDTLDWKNRNTGKTRKAILNGAKNGNVILMHDLYATTASAVEQAVPELIERGIQLVTVSELLAYHKDGIVPGTVYTNLDPKHMKQP